MFAEISISFSSARFSLNALLSVFVFSFFFCVVAAACVNYDWKEIVFWWRKITIKPVSLKITAQRAKIDLFGYSAGVLYHFVPTTLLFKFNLEPICQRIGVCVCLCLCPCNNCWFFSI